ncbi:hypothetical protein [Georhizobium profundi]|uniref:hypothetical protein n=1 Tax=Georhizobium profundi TaxID=2341112 RepID=UPI00196B94B5|nr:hypothetical protein [Georhizobium profundi]
MRISFSPQLRSDALTLEITSGDRLRINGELFNFDPLGEGDTIPAGATPCDWIIGPVDRIDGEVCLTVILPHGEAPEPWQAFPEPLTVIEPGPIDIPSNTIVEVSEQPAEGGKLMIVTTRRWRQDPEVVETFVPDPPPEPESAPQIETEENANVDA